MDSIREYLIGVIAAAVLCGIVTGLLDTKGTVGVAVKLVSGVLMLLSVIHPWVSISLDDIFQWTDDIGVDSTDLVSSAEAMAENEYRDGIIKQTQSYILDEARSLGCDLAIEVILSQDEIPLPEQVRLSGEASPYARQALTAIITEKLGIRREDQIWI